LQNGKLSHDKLSHGKLSHGELPLYHVNIVHCETLKKFSKIGIFDFENNPSALQVKRMTKYLKPDKNIVRFCFFLWF
jgi:hypothetical protein